MRTLLLFRGAPGCGKSTFIKEHGLEPFTISSDNIRLLYTSPLLTPFGEPTISQKSDGVVWDNIFKILEYRMSNGEFTVIDACNSKSSEISRYKKLADIYRYRVYIVDLTGIPLDVTLERNRMRPMYKWVPEESIKNIYSRFETQKVPSGITVIKPEQLDEILIKPIDLSNYKKIVHIGDIHGCYNTLMKYFENNPMDDENCYIFCGDYMDRGDQNLETIKFIQSISNKPNVCLLEGNHEIHISKYGLGEDSASKEFNSVTRAQLVEGGFTEKDARMLYRKLRQCSYYTYHDKEVLACHGGIPCIDSNLLFTKTISLIKGIGRYEDYETIASTWMTKTNENQYLIHGHRNISGSEVQIADRVFNLEGSVEFGGCLRIVELTKDGFNVVEVENVQPVKPLKKKINKEITTVEEAINILRHNPLINEKELGKGISSFNFSRQAFLKRSWDSQTILARGLFINTNTNQIVARSYEKFFNLFEMPQTLPSTLKMKLAFPLKAYLKENGFLGMISWNPQEDDLFIASKSTDKGDFVGYIKDILYKKYNVEKLKEYLKENQGITLIFEVIDPENDPHIIKYDESKLILLDAIYNTINFQKVSYTELSVIGQKLGFKVKELALEIPDFETFKNLYESMVLYDYKFNNEYIEGFVFEDSVGFMLKIKTGYYNEWKKLRSVATETLSRGRYMKTSALTNSMENYFYSFCRKCYDTGEVFTNIIDLREKYLNQSDK